MDSLATEQQSGARLVASDGRVLAHTERTEYAGGAAPAALAAAVVETSAVVEFVDARDEPQRAGLGRDSAAVASRVVPQGHVLQFQVIDHGDSRVRATQARLSFARANAISTYEVM